MGKTNEQVKVEKFLGQGSYNAAYLLLVEGFDRVFKEQIRESRSDTPERSIRLWNQIHAKKIAEVEGFAAKEFTLNGREGWTSPYVKGNGAKDYQIRVALIDIFNSKGRIVIDAFGTCNFISVDERAVCVDVGLALQLERRKEESESLPHERKYSDVSIETWEKISEPQQVQFERIRIFNPQTVDTIMALLFIKGNRPDMWNVSFLKGNLQLTRILANAYFIQFQSKDPKVFFKASENEKKVVNESPEKVSYALNKLDEAHAISSKKNDILILNRDEKRSGIISNIKKDCQEILNKYVNSRGSARNNEMFSFSWSTRMFRNTELTETKINHAISLINSINKSESIEKIEELINEALESDVVQKATFKSGLLKSVNSCKEMVSDILIELSNFDSPDSDTRLSLS